MTAESERNLYAVYKNGTIEFQFAKIKVENESKGTKNAQKGRNGGWMHNSDKKE